MIFLSTHTHERISPRKAEEMVKDNTGTGAIVCKLDMNIFRMEIRMSFLSARSSTTTLYSSARSSASSGRDYTV